MATITLAEAKEHIRLRQADTTQDVVLNDYILAADDYIGNFLNQCPFPVKPAIKSAALLLVGDSFKHRTAGVEIKIYPNPAVDNLLYPYRVEMGI